MESSKFQDSVVVLAERVKLRDSGGRCYTALAVHDTMADSSWISSVLASQLPQNKVRRVKINLQTIRDTEPVKTKEHKIQILVGGTYRKIKIYEAPKDGSLPSVHHDSYVREFLRNTFGPVHLPEGDAELLLGLKHHIFSPNSLPCHQYANLKLYESVINHGYKIVCGNIPNEDNDNFRFDYSYGKNDSNFE